MSKAIEYSTVDDVVIITKYLGEDEVVELPNAIDAKVVVEIADGAIKNRYMRVLRIPNTVTSIGNYAFDQCEKLVHLELPDSLRVIGAYAFQGCDALEEIFIPSSVRHIDPGAFIYCDHLHRVDVSPRNTKFTSNDGILFDKDLNKLIYYPVGRTHATYRVPDSVTTIGRLAFAFSGNLKRVDLPDSLYLIEKMAFLFSGLEEIEFGAVSEIENSAFMYCTSLRKISNNYGVELRRDLFQFCPVEV